MAADGTIQTGARRDRVPPVFEPVLREAVAWAAADGGSLYVYGSVANGEAVVGKSDVDLLSIDLLDAGALSEQLSVQFRDLCRAVEVAPAELANFDGDHDEAYGNRVFLRHYCVHLVGPDPAAGLPDFPADARAARGFNGDLDQHLQRWREQHRNGDEAPAVVRARVARKTLLAVAGMVSVHDGVWTTDQGTGCSSLECHRT